MPSYAGREHVGVIADPAVEAKVLPVLRDLAEGGLPGATGASGGSDARLLQEAANFQSLWGGLLMVYNHPFKLEPDRNLSLLESALTRVS